MNRILIAEDELDITTIVERGLQLNGFITQVVKDGCEATVAARSNDFDLLLLDIDLPGKSGWQVLQELRSRGEQIPIIILTAFNDVNDKIRGLEGGANDYITKPFSFKELVARIRLRLREARRIPEQKQTRLKAGKITVDLYTHQIWVCDRLVELSTREFSMIETFVRHPKQVISREQLLSKVWGYNYDPSSNIVDVYVGYLRKKLGSQLIETIRGTGYRLLT
jgi:DNA-binding response OmpR family regulator